MTVYFRKFLILLLATASAACANYKAQYRDETGLQKKVPVESPLHTFYLIGDAGNSKNDSSNVVIDAFHEALIQAPKNSTALFLGDNIYPDGLPNAKNKKYAEALRRLKVQTDAGKGFEGQNIFIPGNHDWYSGLEGLKRQEKFVEKELGKDAFLPENGCPLERINIGKDIVLIIVDSQWYITNWNNFSEINDNCDIKSRAKFIEELEGEIKKARGKTTIVAIHHPIFTNGSHGGQYSFRHHMRPVPVLGSVALLLRKTGGLSPADIENPRYHELRKHIITIAQENKKVIFVSGHDHNLQYLRSDNLPQIVSGGGSKVNTARLSQGGEYVHGTGGYAILRVYKDGSSHVEFIAVNKFEKRISYSREVVAPDIANDEQSYPRSFAPRTEAAIYQKEETQKKGAHRWFWGKRYRKAYSTPVEVPQVSLDTLYGGLKPVRMGGGHQSKSLRLEDPQGREYMMRALRKNAVQYLQAVAFKDHYIEGQFEHTYTESLLMDVFTGSYPYAPFVVGPLADAVEVLHTNPKLYYVPKQATLGKYNSHYGDELYMIEERAASGHGHLASFGYSDKVISTDDMMKKLRKSDKNYVDEAAYVRARLFDMLLGDWDRHEDQWRWAEFDEKNGYKRYAPIPRDRDQVFSIMSDGVFIGTASRLVPGLRSLEKYEENIRNTKGFNSAPHALDMFLIHNADKTVWTEQAQYIQTKINDNLIDEALALFPPEMDPKDIQEIKRKLKGRRKNLMSIAQRYYEDMNKFGVIKGTDKDDHFEIVREPNGVTHVKVYRIIKGEKGRLLVDRMYRRSETKELWIYGLDDDDTFEVKGEGDHYIKLRMVGGQNHDSYLISNKKKVIVYDFKDKKNSFEGRVKKKLGNDYETNIYDYKKLKYDTWAVLPALGYNPDDGFKLGFSTAHSLYGFLRNPYTRQIGIAANYFFATKGFELKFKSEWAKVFGNWNFGLAARYNSPNYSINFFGFGNETINPNTSDEVEGDFDMNYNRVKISTFRVRPALRWKGYWGGQLTLSASYESNAVDSTAGRFISVAPDLPRNIFERQHFMRFEADYRYENKDNALYPTLGMVFGFKAGYVNNLNNSNSFGYIIPELAFAHRLTTNGRLVLATLLKAHINIGTEYEFYQAAAIGDSNGLRAFRRERFTGKNAFFQNTDLRLHLTKFRTGLVPLSIAMYGGFDYGRVWLNEDVSKRIHISYGGGFFLNTSELTALRLGLFHSEDGLRFTFGMGFAF